MPLDCFEQLRHDKRTSGWRDPREMSAVTATAWEGHRRGSQRDVDLHEGAEMLWIRSPALP